MRFLLTCMVCLGCVAAEESVSFVIEKTGYLWSDHYVLDSENLDWVSTVYSRRIRLMTGYDLYNRQGECEVKASENFWCTGLLSSYYTEIDLYEPSGEWMGKIDGQWWTRGAEARYQILDADGRVLAIASLDKTHAGFTITHPDSYQRIVARLKRVYVPEQPDHWEVTVYDTEVLDRRFIQVFAAFAVNRQGDFREDT